MTRLQAALPPHVWADLTAREGDSVIGTVATVRIDRKIQVRVTTDHEVVDRVKAILRGHGIMEPCDGEAEPWERDADWWKG